VTIANLAEDLATTTSRTYAERVVEELIAKAQSLTDMPRRGRVVPEVGDEAYRELIVGQHRLIYRTSDDASLVEVLFAFYAPRGFPYDELIDAE
jgi:plasmid stabilization system protein ParE